MLARTKYNIQSKYKNIKYYMNTFWDFKKDKMRNKKMNFKINKIDIKILVLIHPK